MDRDLLNLAERGAEDAAFAGGDPRAGPDLVRGAVGHHHRHPARHCFKRRKGQAAVLSGEDEEVLVLVKIPPIFDTTGDCFDGDVLRRFRPARQSLVLGDDRDVDLLAQGGNGFGELE